MHRRSNRRNRGRKRSWFTTEHGGRGGHDPNYDLPKEAAVEGPPKKIVRLTEAEAQDVQHVAGPNNEATDTLAYKLRPRPETEDSMTLGEEYEYDENIIVHIENLKTLVTEVHKPHCPSCSMYVKIVRRHGLCVLLTVSCRRCGFKSKPVEMSARLKHQKRGIGASELNERLLLSVLKSRLGIEDLNLFLTCLNINAPSKTVMQKKLNKMADKAEEVNEAEMLQSQTYVNNIIQHAQSNQSDGGADVQTDNAFPCRPQAGGEKSKQSFSAVIEHTTTKSLVIAQSVANKFCRRKKCTHENCKKNYPQHETIASSEKILLRRNLDKIKKAKRVKIRSITTDSSSQLAKAIREYSKDNGSKLKHYNCYVHKLRSLEKNLRAVKLTSKLPAGQVKSEYVKLLAKSIRMRTRLEIQNAKTLKKDDQDFVDKCNAALQNIMPCFGNVHTDCRKYSTVCRHHLTQLGKYTTKHLPYAQHVKLNQHDRDQIQATIFKVLTAEAVAGMAQLFNTNRCESLHSTIFSYAPKFSCWTRNFGGLCHSATHSRTLGKGTATMKLAKAVGILVRNRSTTFKQLKEMDARNKYQSQRKRSLEYKTRRYYLRKRVQNNTLLKDSLYGGSQSGELSEEHNYAAN